MLTELVETTKKFIKTLMLDRYILEKNLRRKVFSYEFKKTSNLGKLYLLPKIHKCLSDISGKFIGNSCIRDSDNVLEKKINNNAMLLTTDMVELCTSITYSDGLNFFKKAFWNGINKQIPISDLVKIVKFVLSNDYFEFSEKEKVLNNHQEQLYAKILRLSMHVPIWMDEEETEFLQTQRFKPLVWLKYINNNFFHLNSLWRKS